MADCLSRSPLRGNCEEEVLDTPIMMVLNVALSEGEWEESLRKDVVVKQIKQYILNGWPNKCKELDEELRDFSEVR